MREIKFRAWSPSRNSYFKQVLYEADGWGMIRTRDVFMEQWIGLKDKNGKDIYECDICSFTSKTGKHIGVVEWLDNLAGFGLRMVKNNFRYTFSGLDTMGVNLDTLEVVGNIHENPEFLEEK